jgi:hypothetical protein
MKYGGILQMWPKDDTEAVEASKDAQDTQDGIVPEHWAWDALWVILTALMAFLWLAAGVK